MIIPFNIKYRPQIESGEYKVRTASGRPARIVCWDFKSQFNEPIYALISDSDGKEYGCPYREDGYYFGNNENYLIIEDGRPQLSRWEKKVVELLSSGLPQNEIPAALYDAAINELIARGHTIDGLRQYYDR